MHRRVLLQSRRQFSARYVSSLVDLPKDTWVHRLQSAALQNVEKNGWTLQAILEAAPPEASLSVVTVTSPEKLVEFWMSTCQSNLKRQLEEYKGEDRIYWALQRRLSYNADFIRHNRWHEAMAIGAQQPSITQKQLHELIVMIAPELSWNQQVGLGIVYATTELHMLADSSPDFQETWSFLRKRLGEWENLDATSESFLPKPETAMAMGTAILSGAASLLKVPSPQGVAARHPAELLWQGVASMGDVVTGGNGKIRGSDPRDFNKKSNSKE